MLKVYHEAQLKKKPTSNQISDEQRNVNISKVRYVSFVFNCQIVEDNS